MANKLTKDDLIHKVLDTALLDPNSGQSKASIGDLVNWMQNKGINVTKGDVIQHAKKMAGIKVQGGNLIADVNEDLGLSFGSRGGGMSTNSLQNYNHFDVDQDEDWEEDYEKTELDLRVGNVDEATASELEKQLKDLKKNPNYDAKKARELDKQLKAAKRKERTGTDKYIRRRGPKMGQPIGEAKMTASKMAKIFKDRNDWGDMGDHVYVKAGNLVVVDTFYYGEQKAIEDLSRAWKPGGHNYDYFRKTYGIDMKIVDTFSEYKATGRHKKITSDGIVGIVLQISGGQDKPITEGTLNEAASQYRAMVQQALKNAGYNLKQRDFMVGALKNQGSVKVTLNGKMLAFADDNFDVVVDKMTKYIKQDPKKYGLTEMKLTEGQDYWEITYDTNNVNGIKTKKGQKVKVKARNAQEAHKKAAKQLGFKDDSYYMLDTVGRIKRLTNEVFNGTPNKNDGNDILRWIKANNVMPQVKSGKFKARDIAKMMGDDVGRPVKPEWVKGALELVGVNLQESVNEAKNTQIKANSSLMNKTGLDGHFEYEKIDGMGTSYDVYYVTPKGNSKLVKDNLATDPTKWINGYLKMLSQPGEAYRVKKLKKESVNEAKRTSGSVSSLANALQKLAAEMKEHAGLYTKAKAKGDEKEMKKHIEHLKQRTALKKKLEKQLDTAVGELDSDVELVANEHVLRSQIRNMVRESLK